jgi:hypothetical protein
MNTPHGKSRFQGMLLLGRVKEPVGIQAEIPHDADAGAPGMLKD